MARPVKKGIPYFSLDVDIFEDDKLFDVQNEFGPLGETIYLRLLCLIYKNGYYYRFESLDKLSAMLVKSIGNKWARDKQVVRQVILFLAKCNLFSSELMRENVLTSARIQRQYLKATGRRQPLNSYEYWIIGENDNPLISVPQNQVSVCNNPVSVCNNPENVYSGTQIKENKSKLYKREESAVSSSVQNLMIFLKAKFNVVGSHVAEDIEYFLTQGLKEDLIRWIVEETVSKNKGYPYAKGFMKNCLNEGKRTCADLKRNKHENNPPSYDLEEFEKLGFCIPKEVT